MADMLLADDDPSTTTPSCSDLLQMESDISSWPREQQTDHINAEWNRMQEYLKSRGCTRPTSTFYKPLEDLPAEMALRVINQVIASVEVQNNPKGVKFMFETALKQVQEHVAQAQIVHEQLMRAKQAREKEEKAGHSTYETHINKNPLKRKLPNQAELDYDRRKRRAKLQTHAGARNAQKADQEVPLSLSNKVVSPYQPKLEKPGEKKPTAIIDVCECAGLGIDQLCVLLAQWPVSNEAWIAEINKFCIAVISHWWPRSTHFGDIEFLARCIVKEIISAQCRFPHGILWRIWFGAECSGMSAAKGADRLQAFDEKSSTIIMCLLINSIIDNMLRPQDRITMMGEMVESAPFLAHRYIANASNSGSVTTNANQVSYCDRARRLTIPQSQLLPNSVMSSFIPAMPPTDGWKPMLFMLQNHRYYTFAQPVAQGSQTLEFRRWASTATNVNYHPEITETHLFHYLAEKHQLSWPELVKASRLPWWQRIGDKAPEIFERYSKILANDPIMYCYGARHNEVAELAWHMHHPIGHTDVPDVNNSLDRQFNQAASITKSWNPGQFVPVMEWMREQGIVDIIKYINIPKPKEQLALLEHFAVTSKLSWAFQNPGPNTKRRIDILKMYAEKTDPFKPPPVAQKACSVPCQGGYTYPCRGLLCENWTCQEHGQILWPQPDLPDDVPANFFCQQCCEKLGRNRKSSPICLCCRNL